MRVVAGFNSKLNCLFEWYRVCPVPIASNEACRDQQLKIICRGWGKAGAWFSQFTVTTDDQHHANHTKSGYLLAYCVDSTKVYSAAWRNCAVARSFDAQQHTCTNSGQRCCATMDETRWVLRLLKRSLQNKKHTGSIRLGYT